MTVQLSFQHLLYMCIKIRIYLQLSFGCGGWVGIFVKEEAAVLIAACCERPGEAEGQHLVSC